MYAIIKYEDTNKLQSLIAVTFNYIFLCHLLFLRFTSLRLTHEHVLLVLFSHYFLLLSYSYIPFYIINQFDRCFYNLNIVLIKLFSFKLTVKYYYSHCDSFVKQSFKSNKQHFHVFIYYLNHVVSNI